MSQAADPLRILLVEDNPSDARLMLEALREAEFDEFVRVANDGVEALVHLRDEAHPLPDLILLDLNLPRKNGSEILSEVKRDRALRHIPVIVLTTSSNEKDVKSSYDLGANAYLIKPSEMEGLFQVARVLKAFWSQTRLYRQ